MSRSALAVAIAASALAVGGCGGGGKEPSRAAAPTPTPTAKATERSTPPADASGTATYCVGRTGRFSERSAVQAFNDEHAGNGLRARYRELPGRVDPLRKRLIAVVGRGCDVARIDLLWVAEFADAGFVSDLTDYLEPREPEFMEPPLDAVRWDDRYWAVPRSADVGLIYYRRDAGPPATWQELYRAAAKGRGFLYQGAPYESLTTHFLEVAYSAGASVLSADGLHSEIDSAEARRALQFMVDGIEDGAVPAAVTRYDEERSRRAFTAGDATFMRNWPYADALLLEADVDYDTFPLPAFGDGDPTSVLAGHAVVLAAEPRDRDAALALVDHLTGEEAMVQAATEAGVAPVLDASWDDPSVAGALLSSIEIQRAIERARPRPVTPAYPLVTRAIFRNVHAALTGRVSPAQALERADREIDRALARFG